MPLRNTVRLLLALGALAAAPLYAQSTSVNPNVKNPNTPVPDTSATSSTMGGDMNAHMGSHKGPGGRPMSNNSIWSDATRIAALLQDAQTNATVNAPVWKIVANEANTLANRLYARTAGKKAARTLATNLRMHVRLMHKAALSGDAAGVRQHASEALPYATQLADWSAPPQRM